MKRLRTFAVTVVVAGALVLSGCAAPTSDLAAGTAATMQQSVELIAERAAAGDIAGALAELDALQARLDEAEGAGTIGAERAGRVQQRIDLVRTDLLALAAQPVPTTTPVPTDEPNEAPEQPAPTTSAPPSSPPPPAPTTEAPPAEPEPEPEPEPSPEPSPEPEPSPSPSTSEPTDVEEVPDDTDVDGEGAPEQ